MHRAQGPLSRFGLLSASVALLAGAGLEPAAFRGSSALAYCNKAIEFGPRPSGSTALLRLQAYLRAELRQRRCQLVEDAFVADTPLGRVPMRNFIAKFAGSSGRAVAITGHYDTKLFRDFRFVGANDGGSSTGLLLELARVLSGSEHKDDIYLVWLDGEEAAKEWTETDSLYGSRHLAEKWAADGTLGRLKALINVDMIGDRDLSIVNEQHSSVTLRAMTWKAAADLGYGSRFSAQIGAIEDDHIPFLKRGVNAMDLIDFDYGPGHRWWHTAEDTPDKLSATSLQIVGSVVLELIRRLETQ